MKGIEVDGVVWLEVLVREVLRELVEVVVVWVVDVEVVVK